MQETIKNKLNKFNYSFIEKNNKLNVKLGFTLNCEILFEEDKSVKIEGNLNRWNFLTGILKLNINGLMIYNTFWLIFLLFIQLYFNTNEFNLPYLPFIVLAWFIIWNLYYLISYYTFKLTIHNWLNNVA